jgi:oxygen-independent coproporphyrinogen-3 oxidase
LGGGTPTIYEGQEIIKLVGECLTSFEFIENPEISIETNPNTVSAEKLALILEAGVNRLSIGVQSFSDQILTAIGRSHSAASASYAIKLAREVGFENINLDFIYGLPSQLLSDWQQTLDTALEFGPEHLALYEMTIEPGTPFASKAEKGELPLPDQDELADMEEAALTTLVGEGFNRYEISNFAKPGRECSHNINYWQNGSYLGLGAGAVSCFDGLRIKNVENYENYIGLVNENRHPFLEAEGLSLEASFRESVVMGLRMPCGISIKSLIDRYDIDPREYYGDLLNELIDQDMLSIRDEQSMICLTEKAFPVANQVLSELV